MARWQRRPTSGDVAMPRRDMLAALAVGLVTIGLAPAAEADGSDTAAAFLGRIYNSYRAGSSGIPLDDPKLYGRYFSPDLAALMSADRAKADAAGEVPALDFDPFIDAQDGEITGLQVGMKPAAKDGSAKDAAVGLVRFRNSGQKVAITLKLVRTKAGWRIDDIVWPEGTLRALYRN